MSEQEQSEPVKEAIRRMAESAERCKEGLEALGNLSKKDTPTDPDYSEKVERLRAEHRSEIERRLAERSAQEQAAEVKEADVAKLEDAIGKAVAEKQPTISREAGGPVIGYTVIVLRQQMGPSEIGFQVLVRGNGVSPQEERVMAKLVHDITGKMLGEEHRVVPVGRMPAPLAMRPNLPPRPAGR